MQFELPGAPKLAAVLLPALLSLGAGLPAQAAGTEPTASRPAGAPAQGYFFVGGGYFESAGEKYMAGQMYVRFHLPRHLAHPYPLILIHGAAQTSVNFAGTPDGREGWEEFFVEKGYAVYVVDQPGRGESPYLADAYGGTIRMSAAFIEQHFTAPEAYNLWPQAHLHTQWPGDGPGKGRIGDPIFDQFYASETPYIEKRPVSQRICRDAVIALLEKIGPSVLIAHSQAGPYGWLIADARPRLVKGLLSLEPGMSPHVAAGAKPGGPPPRGWPLADLPLAYDPPVRDPAELSLSAQAVPDGPGLCRGWLQAEPAHRLPHLRSIPILILSSEASENATYDHCTAKYLAQAGVPVEHVRLPDVGIHGNGHMMMLEKNNLEIAGFLSRWIEEHVK